MEILAEDVDEAPGSLWTRETIEIHRLSPSEIDLKKMDRIVVSIDPSATSEGDEAGIIGASKAGDHGYILADRSLQGSPLKWAQAAINLYHELEADCIVAEKNQGGEMISTIICGLDKLIDVHLVHASRGKQARAEPSAAKYEQGYIHHVGNFPKLEDEMCLWIPGKGESPNRMDAMVWAMKELGLEGIGQTDWLKVIGE
jgi:phage terminase large subunit-like protein